MKKTWLWYFNFLLVQLFFMRLARVVEKKSNKTKAFKLIGMIVPFSGWFGRPYLYIFKFEVQICKLECEL